MSDGGLSEARLERMHDTLAAYAEHGDAPSHRELKIQV